MFKVFKGGGVRVSQSSIVLTEVLPRLLHRVKNNIWGLFASITLIFE